MWTTAPFPTSQKLLRSFYSKYVNWCFMLSQPVQLYQGDSEAVTTEKDNTLLTVSTGSRQDWGPTNSSAWCRPVHLHRTSIICLPRWQVLCRGPGLPRDHRLSCQSGRAVSLPRRSSILGQPQRRPRPHRLPPPRLERFRVLNTWSLWSGLVTVHYCTQCTGTWCEQSACY